MAVTLTNLIYHVAPFENGDAWQKNIQQLLKRIHQFNGKRIVAIVTGLGMAPVAHVKRLFGDTVSQYIEKPNDPSLRERATFFPLLEAVQNRNKHEATFYAHAKGVSTKGNSEAVVYWRNMMYRELLDDPAKVKKLLETYPIVGTHRRRNIRFSDGKTQAPWHFAGTFYWFRHDIFFSRQWGKIPMTGWSVEACPGILFRIEESACVAKDGIKNPYDVHAYAGGERIIDEEIPVVAPLTGLKVEIGGGRVPKGDGYINVDRDVGDVLFDFEALETGAKLPFETDSVAAVYTSHCIEHIRALKPLMREIIRICKVGATVEIRVPHWLSNMAMCHDHKQTIAPPQLEHWTVSALDYWWGDTGKKLHLRAQKYVPTGDFKRWKRLLPHASDNDIFELCPNAAHESQWVFSVEAR